MEIKLTKEQQEVLQFIADNCDPVDVHAIIPTSDPACWEAWVTWRNPSPNSIYEEATLSIDMEDRNWFEL